MSNLSDESIRRSAGFGARFAGGGGFIVGPLKSRLQENAEARLQCSIREHPKNLTAAEVRKIQRDGSRDTLTSSVEMFVHDLPSMQPLNANAQRRALLAQIDGAKELSDAEKNKLRQRIEAASR
jgi:hypothetical protein